MKSIIQFKCQGIINTGQTRKVVEQCPKCAQKKKKRVFNQRLKISIQYTIHFCLNSIQKIIQYYFPRILNSKDYSITFFSRKIQLKQLFKTLSLAEFNSTKYSFNQKTQVSPIPSLLYLWQCFGRYRLLPIICLSPVKDLAS